MRRILIILLLSLLGTAANAQVQLSASDSGSCTTANACLVIPIGGPNNTASISLSGTFSATAQFEASGNGGVTWSSVSATPIAGGNAVTSATAAGTWQATVSGLTNIRVRLSAYSSGSVGVTINLSVVTGGGGGSPTGNAGGAPVNTLVLFTSGSAIDGGGNTGLTNGGGPSIGVGVSWYPTGIGSTGTKFSASGCTNSTLVGSPGAIAGSYVSGTTGTCTVTLTFGNSYRAPNGWNCSANDLTTPADKQGQTGGTTTTAIISGTTVSGDVVSFGCSPY